MIFLDAAFSVFNIIKDSSFCVQHYRFGDVFSQILPLIATKTGQSINIILATYSVSYIIYYLATYLVCGSILKRYDLALVILLMNILFAAHTFYWMLSQLPQAMALLMVLLAIASGRKFNSTGPLVWIAIVIVEVTIMFFHPLTVFALVFAIVFFMLSRYSFTDRKMLYALAALYFIGLPVKMFLFKTPYEDHSASGLKNFVTQFPDYFSLFSNKRFLYNCLVKYYWIPILFTGIVAFYIKTKQSKKLLFFVLFFSGYLMLVNVSYPTAITPEFYIENLYLPLSIFLAIPFVFDLLPAIEKYKMATPLVVLIVLTGCVRIYATHTLYSDRLVLERKYLNDYGDRKVVIKATKADTTQLLMVWGAPYEFLLLSESERHKAASIIIDDKPALRTTEQTKVLIVNWNMYRYSELNPRYFHFTDTTRGYVVGSTPQ